MNRFLSWIFDRQWRSRPADLDRGMLPEGLRVYAIGDIHGHTDLLDRLATMIETDLEREPPRQARAVFIGDYIDRGPDSAGVLDRLASGRFPLSFDTLRGNHEDVMMGALAEREGSDALEHWCQIGGLETIRSYGVHVDRPTRKSLGKLRSAFLDRFPEKHRAFIDATRLSLTLGDYFFVHAGARPGVPLEAQTAEDLMWIRDACYRSPYDFGKVLVHGHTPHPAPENLARRINIDTGAFKWGVLTAVVLEGNGRRFLSTRD